MSSYSFYQELWTMYNFIQKLIGPRVDFQRLIWIILLKFQGHCCGFDGYQDYNKPGLQIPGSCCNHEMFNNSCSVPEVKSAGFTQGCKTKIFEFFKQTSGILGVVALCIAGVEVHIYFKIIFSTK